MEPEPTINVSLTSDPQSLAPIRSVIEGSAIGIGFSQHDAGLLALAVDEALANVIRHGYEGVAGKPIDVEVATQHNPAAISICITDSGRTIDPASIKSRALTDVRPGGLGVHLIQEIMDECHWTPRAEGGMRLSMTKKLASTPIHNPSSPYLGSATP